MLKAVRTRHLSVVGLLILTLVTAGCQDDPDPSHGLVTGALQKLREAKSATVQFDVSLTRQGAVSVVWQGRTAVLFGDPDSSTTGATGTVEKGGNRSTVDLREVVIGDARYHQSERLRLAPGKTWLKAPAGAGVRYGTDVADPDLGLLSPLPFLALWRSVTPEQAAAGAGAEEDIDGVHTRSYRTDFTLGADSGLPAGFARTFPGGGKVTSTIWLDDQGRPLRVVLAGNLDGGYALKATLRIGELGAQVGVSEPAADQVATEYQLTPEP